MNRSLAVVMLVLSLAGGSACGARIDLARSLEVTEVFSGYYDAGITSGLNKLVPSISFRLKNNGPDPINYVQLMVSFWVVGADGEWSSKDVTGIDAEELAPGATGGPVLVRSELGYTIEQPRAELFTHGSFQDVVVKLFARRDGRIVPIGEFPIERRIIPQTTATAIP